MKTNGSSLKTKVNGIDNKYNDHLRVIINTPIRTNAGNMDDKVKIGLKDTKNEFLIYINASPGFINK